MNNNLLIVGAGIYGVVAKEIAESMNCFGKIDFIDDGRKETPNGLEVIGTSSDIKSLSREYSNVIVAIGNADVRLSLIDKIQTQTSCKVATLISPMAYVSPSAKVMEGTIIEPMAVVHTCAVVSAGCIISAGAVINHAATLGEAVHVDCNGTVAGYVSVPSKLKIKSGEVYSENK